MTRLLLSLTLACAFVILLPVAIPAGGLLWLWDGWPRRGKPAVRPRPGPRRRDAVAFCGDALAVDATGGLLVMERRRRNGLSPWWRSRN